MLVSKKMKIVKQLFGESKEEFEDAEKGAESSTQENPSRHLRASSAAKHYERAPIGKPRRVIKIQREVIVQ